MSKSNLRNGRKPKYGYARDIFGRVQQRDVFADDRFNDFEQSQRLQSNTMTTRTMMQTMTMTGLIRHGSNELKTI